MQTIWAASWENQQSAYAKIKTQISFAVTAKMVSAFVFATWIVQPLYFLNTKFQASSHLLLLHSLVCVRPGQNPHCWFSHVVAHMIITVPDHNMELTVHYANTPIQYTVIWAATWEKRIFAYAKTKAQISFAVTAKLISAFVFAITESTIPLLPISEISNLWPSSVVAQSDLCRTWSETPKTPVFWRRGSFYSCNRWEMVCFSFLLYIQSMLKSKKRK